MYEVMTEVTNNFITKSQNPPENILIEKNCKKINEITFTYFLRNSV